MKKLFLYLFVMITCAGSVYATPAREVPKIWIASVLHSYGEVIKGEEIRHAFVIKNQGNADLIIEKAQPD
jgi:hypothetical protein